ncbi:hypothetical protein [Actinoplanes auranticolor]|uniref:TetR family transcriptional regulator n=1 Tax=Actinoplanes auranticolor TaxID=47988 RepID=A0A919VRD8_9ACTN|nr:hypothetical protein [Actinoplanes auranticolor]GIM73601.1 hypothetical protein Aau02nite_56780 [Actinoplanes auranticolor]
MRAVAAELGLTTMAAYRYVADRDELEALIVEEVLRPLDTTPPGPRRSSASCTRPALPAPTG